MCLNKIQVRNQGFTLTELLITVAVLAVIATLTVPNFSIMMQKNKNRTNVAMIQSALNLARSEALTQGTGVRVSASGSWHDGIVVTVDTNSNGAFDDSEDIQIKNFPALESATAVATGGITSITFNARGENTNRAAQTITVTPEVCNGDEKREITVGLTGLVKVVKTAC